MLVYPTIVGVPPQLAALTLAYNINLNGGITHYASGQAAVYCGSGFVRMSDVIKVGAASAAVGFIIWAGIGMAWWKLLGWW